MSKKGDPPPRPRAGKKPYQKPTLRVHGDVRAITKVKGGTKSDGAGTPKTKAGSG